MLIADLATMAQTVANNNVHGPTLLIIGEVVKLHASLQWFSPAQNPVDSD